MTFGPLVEVDWLRGALAEPDVRVVDCRWSLGAPAAGRAAHRAGHIPGASFMDLDSDLSATAGAGGRHPLPDAAGFEASARRAGISEESRVVAYDEAASGGAARLWWLLRHFGHPYAAVLNGGIGAWLEAGGELAAGDEAPPAGDFTARERSGDTADEAEIAAALGSGAPALVDARAPERFAGAIEPVDPVAGHIPGARNAPAAELAPGGRYLDPAALRERLEAGGEGELVAYCGSGVSACTVVLAAELAGLPARLYPGSWSEWSALGRPVETG